MRCWTYVPTYTHIIVLDQPLSRDTSNTHFVTASADLRINDGFFLGKDDEFLFQACNFKIDSMPKLPEIAKAEYFSDEKIEELSPSGQNGNLFFFGHTFNSDIESFIHHTPPRSEIVKLNDEQGKMHEMLLIAATNDERILSNHKTYIYARKRIQYPIFDENAGRLIPTLAGAITDSTQDVCRLQYVGKDELSSFNRCLLYGKQLIKSHDLSRCNYVIHTISRGVDSINVHFELYENAEFTYGLDSTIRVGRNYVEFSIEGDSYEADGVRVHSFSVSLQESENIQLIRMFFITTLCASCLGFFLKYLVKYLLSLINSFIYKLRRK